MSAPRICIFYDVTSSSNSHDAFAIALFLSQYGYRVLLQKSKEEMCDNCQMTSMTQNRIQQYGGKEMKHLLLGQVNAVLLLLTENFIHHLVETEPKEYWGNEERDKAKNVDWGDIYILQPHHILPIALTPGAADMASWHPKFSAHIYNLKHARDLLRVVDMSGLHAHLHKLHHHRSNGGIPTWWEVMMEPFFVGIAAEVCGFLLFGRWVCALLFFQPCVLVLALLVYLSSPARMIRHLHRSGITAGLSTLLRGDWQKQFSLRRTW